MPPPVSIRSRTARKGQGGGNLGREIPEGHEEDLLRGGERLNAADYQIAPNVRAMLQFADLRPLLEGRPSADWALRVVPEYGGPVGPVLPSEWLTPEL